MTPGLIDFHFTFVIALSGYFQLSNGRGHNDTKKKKCFEDEKSERIKGVIPIFEMNYIFFSFTLMARKKLLLESLKGRETQPALIAANLEAEC